MPSTTQDSTQEDRLLSSGEVARLLNMSPKNVRRIAVENNALPYLVPGTVHIRFRESDVRAYLDRIEKESKERFEAAKTKGKKQN